MECKSKSSLKRSRGWLEDAKKLENRINDVDLSLRELIPNLYTQSDGDICCESDYGIELTPSGNNQTSSTKKNSLIIECSVSTRGREFYRTFASFMQDGYESDETGDTKEFSPPVKHRKKSRKRQVYVERASQLQKACANLQLASERPLQMEKKVPSQLEKELDALKSQKLSTSLPYHSDMESVEDLRKTLLDYEEKMIALEAEVTRQDSIISALRAEKERYPSHFWRV